MCIRDRIGPGRGLGPQTRHEVLALLAAGRPMVLDADALSAFARDPGELLAALHADTVLTPHDGEFARLFALQGDRLTRARAAAAAAGCIVLLKGADSVVAAPDGRAAILDHAPPALATAGTGDVLAGTIAALLAQRMPAFEAAAAAAWLHGEAAHRAGARLIASDLPGQLGAALDAAAAAPDSAPADDDGVRAVLFSAGGSS
jgi:NAD(P)H-hydrate epimerase